MADDMMDLQALMEKRLMETKVGPAAGAAGARRTR